MDASAFAERCDRILREVERAVVGKREALELALLGLLADGHVLLEDYPGLAKTLMARSFARVTSMDFARIQFTPDLMPSDITGTDILEEDRATGHRTFRFVRGPLFANIILADEVNRTPPKTQAALLQAMQEYRVTAGGETHPLELPFLVFATQNPIEQEGTYPLPEAQLDRFMFLVDVGYPSAEEEVQIVKSTTSGTTPRLTKILAPEQIIALQELVRRVPVPDHVVRYAVDLVRHTRPKESSAPDFVRKHVNWGAGPRASQYLVVAAKARAVLQGRYAASVEDVRTLALPVLRHRVLPNFAAESEGITSQRIVQQLVELVKG
jgi:MoxR-like ATPase